MSRRYAHSGPSIIGNGPRYVWIVASFDEGVRPSPTRSAQERKTSHADMVFYVIRQTAAHCQLPPTSRKETALSQGPIRRSVDYVNTLIALFVPQRPNSGTLLVVRRPRSKHQNELKGAGRCRVLPPSQEPSKVKDITPDVYY